MRQPAALFATPTTPKYKSVCPTLYDPPPPMFSKLFVTSMMKVFVLAVIGAACSSVAFAAEVKKDKAHVPAVKATTMSDAQMDKVTAGLSFINGAGNTVDNDGRGHAFGISKGGGAHF